MATVVTGPRFDFDDVVTNPMERVAEKAPDSADERTIALRPDPPREPSTHPLPARPPSAAPATNAPPTPLLWGEPHDAPDHTVALRSPVTDERARGASGEHNGGPPIAYGQGLPPTPYPPRSYEPAAGHRASRPSFQPSAPMPRVEYYPSGGRVASVAILLLFTILVASLVVGSWLLLR
jgi:hypothetical protein